MSGFDVQSLHPRIAFALALSAGLHLSLIYGIAPRPGARARAIPPLAARLVSEPVAQTPSAHGRRIAPQTPVRLAAAVAMPIAVPAAPLETVLIAEPPANGAERVERHEDTTLPKADLPSLLDLQWYEARDLDSYPRPLAAIEPSYPSARQADGRPGHVTLMLAIDETGVVRDAVLVSAEPEGVFETAALAAARAALFAPARKNGSAVRSKIVVKLRFAAEHPIQ